MVRQKVITILACSDPDYLPYIFQIFGEDGKPFLLALPGITGKITLPEEQGPILNDINKVGFGKLYSEEVYLVGHSLCKWISENYQLYGVDADEKQIEFLNEGEKVIKAKTKIKKVRKFFLHTIDGKVVPEVID